jgi:acetyl esterase/lipase
LTKTEIMTSRHLVDPDLRDFIDTFAPIELSTDTLVSRRAEMAAIMSEHRRPDPECQCTEIIVPADGASAGVRVLMLRPKKAAGKLPAVLHLHGGLYVLGSAEDGQAQNQLRARELGCVVVAVDYRLAPETPFPGPLDDCYTALRWLTSNAADLNIDPRRIAVVGESAGGGLAAALSLWARDNGEHSIAFQQLIYPMLDDRTGSTHRANPYAGEFVLTVDANRAAWQMYLGHDPGASGTSTYAAAARADDLKALPRTHISVGSLDLYVDEDIDYARRLIHAGVPTELHVYPGAVHAFDMAVTHGIGERFTRANLEALSRGLETTR